MPTIEIPDEGPPFQGLFGLPQPGQPGPAGPTGAAGVGVPTAGTTGQILAKNTNTNFDTHWIDPPTGGGGGTVTSVDGDAGPAVVLTGKYQQLAAVQTINVNTDSPVTVAAGRAYTANLTSGNIVYNLPSAPANNTRAMFTVSAVASTNTATVNCGGSDHFTTPSTGPTAKTLNKVGQSLVLQYHAASAIWIVQADPIRTAVSGYATLPNTATAGQLATDVQIDIQEFGVSTAAVGTITGTWTKPSWAVAGSQVTVELVGGGGQGGSGRRGATSTLRCGGGGGQAGFRSWATFDAGDLPGTVSVQAGTGGLTGTSPSTDDTDGTAGAAGAASFFGKYVYASGGGGGQGGNNTAGGAGGTTVAGSRGRIAGAPGIAGSDTATKDADLASATVYAAGALTVATLGNGGGGGGGAAINASNANVVGSRGGDVDWYSDGTTQGGAAGAGAFGGTIGVTADAFSASGGGGGGRANGANALAGGIGGFPGGGGGGGGAALDTFSAGPGGQGGNGFVRVTTRP